MTTFLQHEEEEGMEQQGFGQPDLTNRDAAPRDIGEHGTSEGHIETGAQDKRAPSKPVDPLELFEGEDTRAGAGEYTAEQALRDKDEVQQMAARVRKTIRVIAWILASVFAFLKLRGIPTPQLNSDQSAITIIQITLVLYFFCWVFGASGDAAAEASVLAKAPHKARIPPKAWFLMGLLGVVFSVLCWVESHQQFAVVLLLFWTLNLVSWVFLVRESLQPVFEKSETIFANLNDQFSLIRSQVVREFITGRWQYRRFLAGLIAIGAINLGLYLEFWDTLASAVPKFSAASFKSSLILLFVVASEMWIWIRRAKRSFDLTLLRELEAGYTISPKRKTLTGGGSSS